MTRSCLVAALFRIGASVLALGVGAGAVGTPCHAGECAVGVIETIAGGEIGDGGPATEAALYRPGRVALGSDGCIYIAEDEGHRVRKVDQAGTIATLAGDGRPGYSGDGGPAVNARLCWPRGMAFGPDGSLCIADAGNHRIRKIDPQGVISTVAGNGEATYAGDGGPATQASLSEPFAVAVAGDGSLFIADMRNNVIRKVNPAGIITTVAGGGAPADGLGDGGPATECRLNGPRGVILGPDGSIYIGDADNDRVRRIDPAGIITTVAGNGKRGHSGAGGPAGMASLNRPHGLALGADGTLYIAGNDDHCIHKIEPLNGRVDAAAIITTIAGSGEPGYRGDGGLAINAILHCPNDVAVDDEGSLYIADRSNQRIRGVDAAGVITTVAGGMGRDNVAATKASLCWPAGIALGVDNSIYVVDQRSHRIRRVSPDGIITTVAGNGDPAYAGDGGPAIQASINGPEAVAVAPDGSLYIAMGGSGRVRKVDLAGVITTVAGGGKPPDVFRDGGPATEAMLNWPTGIAVGPDGALYIADQDNERVRRVDSHGTITTVAGTGPGGWDKGGYAGDGGPATEARLNWPWGVAFGPEGSLYVVDHLNHRIRKVGPDGVITTIAGSGPTGWGNGAFGGDGGPATEARLSFPQCVAVGSDGSLYIADTGNDRIRKIDPAGIITTVVGAGDSDGDLGDGGPATEASLDDPFGMALDADGTLYVADQRHHRIRRIRWWSCDQVRAKAEELKTHAGESPEAWRQVAIWYLSAQSWDDALSAVQRSLALTPEQDHHTRMRVEVLAARSYIGKGDDHEARRWLIRVMARADDPVTLREAVDGLVDLHLRRGERELAIAILNDLRTRTRDQRLLDHVSRRLREIAGEG